MNPVYPPPRNCSNSGGQGGIGHNFRRSENRPTYNARPRSYSPMQEQNWNSPRHTASCSTNTQFDRTPRRGARYSSSYSSDHFVPKQENYSQRQFRGSSSRYNHYSAPNHYPRTSHPESYQNKHTGNTRPYHPKSFQVKILYLLRGAPGSGKSTLARQLSGRNGIILSTDEYFSTPKGYFFDPAKLSEAHNWNKDRAEYHMINGHSPVIIDNTNMESWEMEPYMLMALDNAYTIEIVEPDTLWKFDVLELAKRNCHGVTRDRIEKMLQRYEPDVTVELVLGRERYDQYQKKCLRSSTSRGHRKSRGNYRYQPPRHVTPRASAIKYDGDIDQMMGGLCLNDSVRPTSSHMDRDKYRLYE